MTVRRLEVSEYCNTKSNSTRQKTVICFIDLSLLYAYVIQKSKIIIVNKVYEIESCCIITQLVVLYVVYVHCLFDRVSFLATSQVI